MLVVEVVIDIDGVAVVIRLAVDKIIPATSIAWALVGPKRKDGEAESRCALLVILGDQNSGKRWVRGASLGFKYQAGTSEAGLGFLQFGDIQRRDIETARFEEATGFGKGCGESYPFSKR